MFSAFVVSQILIAIALVFDLASFQFKSRKITLLCFAAAASLISAHFFLLGAVTAGAVVAVSVLRFATAYFTSDRRVMYGFLCIVLALGMFTYDGFEDILITAGMLFATIAAFSVNERRLREFMGAGTVLIIIHNIIIFTPAGILLEVFFLGSNLLSYWRFYVKKPVQAKER